MAYDAYKESEQEVAATNADWQYIPHFQGVQCDPSASQHPHGGEGPA